MPSSLLDVSSCVVLFSSFILVFMIISLSGEMVKMLGKLSYGINSLQSKKVWESLFKVKECIRYFLLFQISDDVSDHVFSTFHTNLVVHINFTCSVLDSTVYYLLLWMYDLERRDYIYLFVTCSGPHISKI